MGIGILPSFLLSMSNFEKIELYIKNEIYPSSFFFAFKYHNAQLSFMLSPSHTHNTSQTSQIAHADPCPLAHKHQNLHYGVMIKPGLMNYIFFFILWTARHVCNAYLKKMTRQKDILWTWSTFSRSIDASVVDVNLLNIKDLLPKSWSQYLRVIQSVICVTSH